MPRPDYDAAIAYALERLRRELPPGLAYHNLWHTQFDVLPAAARLGAMNHLPADEIRLLEVAAAFHDIGFIKAYEDHERVGVEIVRTELPVYGFRERQIELVSGMILATRLPQSPKTHLEEIIVDADLDVLGREDFFERNELLRQELALLGRSISWREWQLEQVHFLRQHTYFTPAARALRDGGKERHIETIQEWLRKGISENGSRP